MVLNALCLQICTVSYPAGINCAKTLIELENYDVCIFKTCFCTDMQLQTSCMSPFM